MSKRPEYDLGDGSPFPEYPATIKDGLSSFLTRGSERFSWRKALFVIGGIVVGTGIGWWVGTTLGGHLILTMATVTVGGLAGAITGDNLSA